MKDEDDYYIAGSNGRAKKAKPVVSIPQGNVNQSNKRRPSQGIVGNSLRAGLTASKRIVKSRVFATRFAPDMTENHVKQYLLGDPRLMGQKIDVKPIKTKYDSYASFLITCICEESVGKVFLEPDMWSQDILVRPWREKRVVENNTS